MLTIFPISNGLSESEDFYCDKQKAQFDAQIHSFQGFT
jgi:hypothetical protein